MRHPTELVVIVAHGQEGQTALPFVILERNIIIRTGCDVEMFAVELWQAESRARWKEKEKEEEKKQEH